MATHALVGRYLDDGGWRAVWVHMGGAPEDLGARLVRAVELHGGDPGPVIDHVFSTSGWSAWPGLPHHPEDPDDLIFTPANVIDDVHWRYLFDVSARRLDVLSGARTTTPERQVQFGRDGRADVPLGESELTLAQLSSTAEAWRRRCPAPIAAALDGVLDDLGVPADAQVGVGERLRPDGPMRELQLRQRTLHLPARGVSGAKELFVGERVIPLPPAEDWFEDRIPRWEALCHALGMDLEVVDSGELFRFRKVVEEVTDARREMSVAEAETMGVEFSVGDELGQVIARAHVVWRWLFDQAWVASEGSDRS